MQVPKRFAEAGWFADGPNPGETGLQIAGHADSNDSTDRRVHRLGGSPPATTSL
jgi:hypothetical protein